MKTTYEHYGSHCIIRETIICEENVIIVITRCVGGDTPEQATNVEVKQFPSAPDARRDAEQIYHKDFAYKHDAKRNLDELEELV